MRTCSVEGCENKHYGRGYCQLHWGRWKHSGSTERTRMFRVGVCSRPGCEGTILARGLCVSHYNKADRLKKGLGIIEPPEDRFWAKVDKESDPNGCWIWTGARKPEGYGRFSHNGRPMPAHRFAYELHKGPIPAGLVLDHICENPPCVNPDHLEPTTRTENIMLGIQRERSSDVAVIVTTTGRPSLIATLCSIKWQWNGEQVIVVSDGPSVDARAMFHKAFGGARTRASYVEHIKVGGYGHQLRNFCLDHLMLKSHFVSIDDDDVYLPGAFDLFRTCRTNVPVIFRARWGEGHRAAGVELWQHRQVVVGNVATPMILSPVGKSRWGTDYYGDFTYYTEAVEEFGEPIWRDELIALVRPV